MTLSETILKEMGWMYNEYDYLKKKFGALKVLGSGSYGEAYLLKNGKVLKITHDPDEIYVCYKLKGKKLKYVAEIYDVQKLSNDDSVMPESREYFAIKEYLKPLEGDDADKWSTVTNWWNYRTVLQTTPQKMWEESPPSIFNNYEEFEKFYLNAQNLYKELVSLKLKNFHDLKAQNCGWKNGVIASFDMEVYESYDGGPSPKVLKRERGMIKKLPLYAEAKLINKIIDDANI